MSEECGASERGDGRRRGGSSPSRRGENTWVIGKRRGKKHRWGRGAERESRERREQRDTRPFESEALVLARLEWRREREKSQRSLVGGRERECLFGGRKREGEREGGGGGEGEREKERESRREGEGEREAREREGERGREREREDPPTATSSRTRADRTDRCVPLPLSSSLLSLRAAASPSSSSRLCPSLGSPTAAGLSSQTYRA
eukprot:scaffold222399_cov29-Tisochrysis_lutea.AAC.1